MSQQQPTEARQDLRDRYEDLERQKGNLQDQVRSAEADNGRREVRLVHVEQAVMREHRDRTLLAWLLGITVVILAVIGYTLLSAGTAEDEVPVNMVYKTHAPRLMVTSSPSPALVFINGKTAGQTPLVRPLPTSKKVTVEVRVAGYNNWKQTFEVGTGMGRHVHADFAPPAPKPATPEKKADRTTTTGSATAPPGAPAPRP